MEGSGTGLPVPEIPEERVGVEPTLDLRPNLISNQALSATQPPLRTCEANVCRVGRVQVKRRSRARGRRFGYKERVGQSQDDDADSRTKPAPGSAPSGKVTPSDMPAVGAVLGGRFHLEEQLGRGGSGVVFRAFDRVMGEALALKILFPERAADDAWVRRLVREVKIARSIMHPSVRRIFEVAEVDGYWLITMELGVGTLGDELRAAREGRETHEPPRRLRPWRERLSDARAVCDGLATLHTSGITHRDVTPSNVLRMADGRLVMSDFGLALLDGETTALLAGTPNYVAPEVLDGARADQRSDVWQLGLVLHEIVFGQRPRWQRDGDRQTLLPPVGVDAATPTDELLRLLALCLRVDARQRADGAVAVARELERTLGGTVVAGRSARRTRRTWQAALALGVVALAGVVAVWLPRWRAAHAPGAASTGLAGVGPTVAPAPLPPPVTPSSAAAAAETGPQRLEGPVRVHIESRPSHARLVDVGTGQLWGETPFDSQRSARAGTTTLRIVKRGFEPALVQIVGDRDVVEIVDLRPREVHEPGEATPADPQPAAAPTEPEKL
jgi:Protein kinase domain